MSGRTWSAAGPSLVHPKRSLLFRPGDGHGPGVRYQQGCAALRPTCFGTGPAEGCRDSQCLPSGTRVPWDKSMVSSDRHDSASRVAAVGTRAQRGAGRSEAEAARRSRGALRPRSAARGDGSGWALGALPPRLWTCWAWELQAGLAGTG